MDLIVVSAKENDVCQLLRRSRIDFRQISSAYEAMAQAGANTGLLILADDYPDRLTAVDPALYEEAALKDVRLYVEFPNRVPHLEIGPVRKPAWERVVVTSSAFEPTLQKLRILMAHDCRFVDIAADTPHLAMARVAGFDTALYGLPDEMTPILFEQDPGSYLIATTKLSQFLTGRYAPPEAWAAIWQWILGWACGGEAVPDLIFTPVVRPSYQPEEDLHTDGEQQSFERGIAWFDKAKLLIHPSWYGEARRRRQDYPDGTGPGPEPVWPVGDGSCGMIEGASSTINPDGSQTWRYHVRNDCMGEVAMARAFAGVTLGDERSQHVAANLNDFIYFDSIFAQGPRADPGSASYGLLSWALTPPADGVYYGDDNARSMLGTMSTAALLNIDRWDKPLLRCLLANLRTTGPLGFRGRRLEEATLQKRGWRYYWETQRIHYAPHYESWLWACFLWAYHHTGFAPFLERTLAGIRMTMATYPDAWQWTNGMQQERARMLLPLAWLVRIDDTPTHRGWLRRMANELLRRQDASGAIAEEVGSRGHGAYGPPESNEAYGTTEAPLIQRNGDPLCDLLYTTNFALVGLHEAAAATGDSFYTRAEDRLTEFLCRIQIRSDTHAELDGGWFRAFDFRRWAYWASNADVGWGAWCIESGWTQGWITTVLALRQMKTSLWALTAGSGIGQYLDSLRAVMLPDADKDMGHG